MSIIISNNLNESLQKDAENIKNILMDKNNRNMNVVIDGGSTNIKIRIIRGKISKNCIENLLSEYNLNMIDFDDKVIYVYV